MAAAARVFLVIAGAIGMVAGTLAHAETRTVPTRHAAAFDGAVNDDDAQLGFFYRYRAFPQWLLGVFVAGSMRPEGEITLQEVRPHFLIQREEDRYFVAAGFEKDFFPASTFDLFFGVGGGYTFAAYEGSNVTPEEGWTALIRAGGVVRIPIDDVRRILVRVGYQYVDLRSVPDDYFYAALGAEF